VVELPEGLVETVDSAMSHHMMKATSTQQLCDCGWHCPRPAGPFLLSGEAIWHLRSVALRAAFGWVSNCETCGGHGLHPDDVYRDEMGRVAYDNGTSPRPCPSCGGSGSGKLRVLLGEQVGPTFLCLKCGWADRTESTHRCPYAPLTIPAPDPPQFVEVVSPKEDGG